MKPVLSVIIFFSYFFMSFEAKSTSCQERAMNCVAKWGAPHGACYESFRLAACEKTGKYVAPNGNVWPASRIESHSRNAR
jgi:hypothetical protein